jgi:hypothetical protein
MRACGRAAGGPASRPAGGALNRTNSRLILSRHLASTGVRPPRLVARHRQTPARLHPRPRPATATPRAGRCAPPPGRTWLLVRLARPRARGSSARVPGSAPRRTHGPTRIAGACSQLSPGAVAAARPCGVWRRVLRRRAARNCQCRESQSANASIPWDRWGFLYVLFVSLYDTYLDES